MVDVPHSSRGGRRGSSIAHLVVVAALVALTVASYLAWLGWDQKRRASLELSISKGRTSPGKSSAWR
jgi:threonine/homoserine/homoserine lactone efflux protein